jgi:AcrR family transcriptional regulator
VVQEKGFTGASVQAIVERANVSRGTFYAHYTDKYALIESLIREGLQHALSALPAPSDWTRATFQQLIRLVLEHLRMIYQHHHRLGEVGPYLDRAVQTELNTLILAWLEQKTRRNDPHPPIELMAQAISSAVFGAAVQWSQQPSALSSEQAASEIAAIILDGATSSVRGLFTG